MAALPSPATLGGAAAMNASGSVAAGLANRLIDSGGRSAGTGTQLLQDAAFGAAKGVATETAGPLVKRAVGEAAAKVTPGLKALMADTRSGVGLGAGGDRLAAGALATSPWRNGTPLRSVTVGAEGLTMFRVHGASGSKGAWGAALPYASQAEARAALGIRPEWNAATHLSQVRLAPGTQIQIGFAAPQGEFPGGGIQIQILNTSDIARQSILKTKELLP
jgi:hypothetical protein